jgi:hypothetical protein
LDPERLSELIEAGDLNGLLRAIDALCEARDWDGILDLADKCEDAVERGKQLWPISAHVDYRIALEAPGEYAARILHPEAGRFASGPLTEVVASTHRWDELAPFVEAPQDAAYLAQERVLRGEHLEGDERAHPEILELPLSLQEWEPTYALARYLPHTVEVAEPWEPKTPMRAMDRSVGEELDEPEIEQVLLDLVHPWTSESNGAAQAVVVEGGAEDAISAITFGPVVYGELGPAEAVQRLAWTAASAGAHGRRRGAAFGRSMAWHVTAVLADLEWPLDPRSLGTEVSALKWYRFEETQDEQLEGWFARLAVADETHGWAAALSASDIRETDVDDQ